MAGETTRPGYTNRNNQTVLRRTNLPGNDRNQYVHVLRCGNCGHEYGLNGSDKALENPLAQNGRGA